MRIPSIGELIVDCWLRAEETVCTKIVRDSDEEYITNFLRGELEKELGIASSRGAVEAAFLRDLREGFPELEVDDNGAEIARGLVATVAFHPRHVEGKTGGDLGIVLQRPDVQESIGWPGVEIKGDYKRGLLCQAKLLGRNLSWGKLTKAQQTNLPNKLKYSGLLLYKYEDRERRRLYPFRWQLTANANIREVGQWLLSGVFPSLKNSRDLLSALVRDEIGEHDPDLIAKDITPPMQASLTISVHWKNDKPPGSVYLHKKLSTAAHRYTAQSQ